MPPLTHRRQLSCQGQLTTNIDAKRVRGLRSNGWTESDAGPPGGDPQGETRTAAAEYGGRGARCSARAAAETMRGPPLAGP